MPRQTIPTGARGRALLPLLALLGGCATSSYRLTPARVTAAEEAVARLRRADFEGAGKEAGRVLERDPRSSLGRVVRAVSQYRGALHQLWGDVEATVLSSLRRGLNERYLRWAVEQSLAQLERVDADLEVAERDPDFHLDLCLACWEVDWNRNGRIDSRDRRLFEIELGGDGQPLPDEDPRRRPTFRFDAGDVSWARAMVAFQRAVLTFVLGYSWDGVNDLLRLRGRFQSLRFALADGREITRARDLVLEGLGHAERCRARYLAEADDEREWLPSPRQKDHPMPLPVDEPLYQTWADVIGDARRLLRSEEGVDLGEVTRLAGEPRERLPAGFLDLGRIFSSPRELVFESPKDVEVGGLGVEEFFRRLLGDALRPSMTATPLLRRLERMRGEIKTGQESFERKLRYFLWLN